MKKILSLVFMMAVFFSACTEEDTDPVLIAKTASVLSMESIDLAFTEEQANEEVTIFNWTDADFNFSAAVTYTVVIDKADGDFSGATTILTSAKASPMIKVDDFNNKLLSMKLSAGIKEGLQAKVMALVNGTEVALTSEPIAFSATPYLVEIAYPEIYVPGGHQGWNPGEAPALLDIDFDKVYKGYVSYPAGSEPFKFVGQRDWNPIQWGRDSDNPVEGKLLDKVVSGREPSNIEDKFDAGVYFLTVDLSNPEDLTYTMEAKNWAIIGNGANGWGDGDDAYLDFDNQTGLWTKTLDLKKSINPSDDGIKFRINGNWNSGGFGDDGADGTIDGGGNIQVPEDGSYIITANFGPGNGAMTYTIVKNEK